MGLTKPLLTHVWSMYTNYWDARTLKCYFLPPKLIQKNQKNRKIKIFHSLLQIFSLIFLMKLVWGSRDPELGKMNVKTKRITNLIKNIQIIITYLKNSCTIKVPHCTCSGSRFEFSGLHVTGWLLVSTRRLITTVVIEGPRKKAGNLSHCHIF